MIQLNQDPIKLKPGSNHGESELNQDQINNLIKIQSNNTQLRSKQGSFKTYSRSN